MALARASWNCNKNSAHAPYNNVIADRRRASLFITKTDQNLFETWQPSRRDPASHFGSRRWVSAVMLDSRGFLHLQRRCARDRNVAGCELIEK
jgi:hypothetical protein